MKRLTCECCGAPLTPKSNSRHIVCDYCKAVYETYISNQEFVIKLINPGIVKPLKVGISLDEESLLYFPKDKVQGYILDNLSRQLVEKLKEELIVREEIDPKNFRRVYWTKINLMAGNTPYE